MSEVRAPPGPLRETIYFMIVVRAPQGPLRETMMMMSLIFVLAETKNRSQAPYIPLGRYVPYEAV